MSTHSDLIPKNKGKRSLVFMPLFNSSKLNAQDEEELKDYVAIVGALRRYNSNTFATIRLCSFYHKKRD